MLVRIFYMPCQSIFGVEGMNAKLKMINAIADSNSNFSKIVKFTYITTSVCHNIFFSFSNCYEMNVNWKKIASVVPPLQNVRTIGSRLTRDRDAISLRRYPRLVMRPPAPSVWSVHSTIIFFLDLIYYAS